MFLKAIFQTFLSKVESTLLIIIASIFFLCALVLNLIVKCQPRRARRAIKHKTDSIEQLRTGPWPLEFSPVQQGSPQKVH